MKNVFLALAVAGYLKEASSRLESEERLDVDLVNHNAWDLAFENSDDSAMRILNETF